MKFVRVQKICFVGLVILLSVLYFMPGTSWSQEKNRAYWTDSASDIQIEQINLTAGETKTVRLITEIPAGKTLKAYSIMVEYNSAICAVNEVNPIGGSALSPKNINSDHPAQVTINGFDIHGASGPAAISLIDVTLEGKSYGTFDLKILTNSYGANVDDQFKPDVVNARVTVIE